MKYLYFKDPKGNFGDDLNPWLWDKLLGDAGENSDSCLLGIGTILMPSNKLVTENYENKKIVFGSGARPSLDYKKLTIDNDLWDIRFLRGPLSSYYFDNKYKYITDAAYAIRLLPSTQKLIDTEKKYDVSVMPYYKSTEFLDWDKICKEMGFHYISPHSENGVEATLQEIAASKYIITEAMHGAILADALRVPWHRFVFSAPHFESSAVSDFKWMDWLMSIKLNLNEVTYLRFYQKTIVNAIVSRLSNYRIHSCILSKKSIKKDITNLLQLPKRYYISDDTIIKEIDDKMQEELFRLKNDIANARL